MRHSSDIIKHGKTAKGKQRYCCQNTQCLRQTFIRNYSYQGYEAAFTDKVVDMTLNGSGIRDCARVLKVSTGTIINHLKKREDKLDNINHSYLKTCTHAYGIKVRIVLAQEAE